MSLSKKYDANQQYLYDLKKMIIELKPHITKASFLNQLDQEFTKLTEIEDGDLARATKYLNQIDISIRTIVSNYISTIEENTNNSQDYLFITSIDSIVDKMEVFSEPNINSQIRYVCKGNCEVKVIDNTGNVFFKVIVDGYSGYVSKHYLKRQW